MIILRPLVLTQVENGKYALAVGFELPPFNLPMAMLIIGLEGKEDLPKVAEYLYSRVIEIYDRWDMLTQQFNNIHGQSPIPKPFLEAFDEGANPQSFT